MAKNFFQKIKDNIRTGDRMIWIIAVMLMLVSLVAIFSSTSTHAMRTGISRTLLFRDQAFLVIGGILVLVMMSAIPNIKYIRVMSQYGFAVSMILLLMVVFDVHLTSRIRAVNTNEATRAIYFFGLTIQVYEVVKVAMVMYLSWALHAYEGGKFVISNNLGTKYPEICGWMKSPRAQRWIYLYTPIILVMGLTFPGSTSSALMVGIIMGMTLIIGGIKVKDLAGLIFTGICGICLLVSLHVVSSGRVIPRLQTGFNRLGIELPYPDAQMREKQKAKIAAKKIDPEKVYDINSKEFNEYRNKTLQNNSAEVAFVQGGRRIMGKGPGKSTQKYIVPLIFEDYMFSFLMEEYGIFGGLIVIILYMSLFARGTILVESCNGRYAKTCVGGLVFLITFQAMFHILINCNIGILTGQTLPMISHGKSSFICFTIAFGVILSISKMANKKIQEEMAKVEKMMMQDDVSSAVSAMEDLETQLNQE